LATRQKSFSRLKDVRSFFDGSSNLAIHNSILLGLPNKECDSLFAKLEYAELPKHTVLCEFGEPIKFAYFINSGLLSFLSVMADGKSLEVGLVGKEGFAGAPLLVGFTTSPTRAVMQISGTGFKIADNDLEEALQGSRVLNTGLLRFSQVLAMQATQIAACNRLHEVDKRLARWLLMSQDRVGGDSVSLTQETLANMLGTRRASVTVAAGALQKKGLITYRRGDVKIDNRQGLEEASCECYETMKRLAEKWKNEGASR
jgi:CRP-like cAMP-binding protein